MAKMTAYAALDCIHFLLMVPYLSWNETHGLFSGSRNMVPSLLFFASPFTLLSAEASPCSGPWSVLQTQVLLCSDLHCHRILPLIQL